MYQRLEALPTYTSNWRPDTSVFKRSFQAMENGITAVIQSHNYRLETAGFLVLSGLMCDLNLNQIPKPQQQLLVDFFDQSMYLNHALDPLVARTHGKRHGLIFTETFYQLPQKVAALKKFGIDTGLKPESLEAIELWYDANRVLNSVSYQLASTGTLSWRAYDPLFWSLEMFPSYYPKTEQAVIAGINSAFNQWPYQDSLSQAIWLRSLSSAYYAKTLGTLVLNQALAKESLGQLKRLIAMIQAAQLLDDFNSPAKDKKYSIFGVAASGLKSSQVNSQDQLYVSPEDTTTAIMIARECLGALLEAMQLDPRHPSKKTLARIGLMGAVMATRHSIRKEDLGTYYPMVSAALSVLNELTTRSTNDDFQMPYKKITHEALNSAISVILQTD